MKIYENARIRVTLTDEQSAVWNDRRDRILSQAMSILGNRAEIKILETETISDEEAIATAIEELAYQHLTEHCRYNISETLMRMKGGHMMSEGMAADVAAARAYARNELRNDPTLIEAGRAALLLRTMTEKNYRQSKGHSDWQIEITGDMPEQIGLCRYR